jgi:hypothetical protein
MPYLGDYLGQLLSEICMARMQADLETVRVAELYATHPLLRTMPVPHVRLPDVELDIPVLVKSSEPPRAGESPRGGAPIDKVKSRFDEVFSTYLARAGIALTPSDKKKLRTALDEQLAQHAEPTETGVDVRRLGDDLTSAALRTVELLGRAGEGRDVGLPAALADELKETVRVELVKLRTLPPRLTVLVTSAELREAGTGENITRLRLKVAEQGVEWTTIESNGQTRDRLVPE